MFLGAINTQQRLGALVVALLVVGWIVYILMQLRRSDAPPPGSEIELAPNRKPYYTDEELEGPKLD